MTHDDAPAATAGTEPRVTLATWVGFIAMSVGLFMAILDMQIVATSLPTIQTALGIHPDAMSWVQTAYIAAEVITIPITGLLTRALGMRWLFVLGVVLFAIASAGCAMSNGLVALIACRIVQGFAAGTLIPAVFSAVFLLFPPRTEALATSIAGVVGVLAPIVGPIVGGYITHQYSWHWLFLINIAPAVAAAIAGWTCLPRDPLRPGLLGHLDLIALLLLATALTALIVALKQAPEQGWGSLVVLGLLVLAAATGWLFVRRTRASGRPIVTLSVLSDPRTAVGCALNFAFGFGIFGSVYLMPVFLALVREHDSLEIGRIMLVTGIAQLITAPIAVAIEKRVDPRWLSLFGFVLFAIGLAMSCTQTIDTDLDQMMVPQIIRGVAVLFCILPPTRLALGHLPADTVPDTSGLFNVMRNIGGAIGLSLIDTVIYGRAPGWGNWIASRLLAGDVGIAKAVGIPLDAFLAARGQPIDQETRDLVEPMVRKLALTYAINEAWLVLAAITLVAIAGLWWTRRRTWEGET